MSDEFHGVTEANEGQVWAVLPRRFSSLSEAEKQKGQSPVSLGIHWPLDKTEGIAQGRRVADYVFRHAFVPRRRAPGRSP